MNAIDWIRARADLVFEERDTVKPEFATDEHPAGTPYLARYYLFRGTVQPRMRRELQASELTGDETIHFGAFVHNANDCRYTRSEIQILN